jgi:hypothetical protein
MLDRKLRRIAASQYVQEILRGTVVELQAGERVPAATSDGSVDVVFAPEAAPGELEALAADARRVLKADGVLVVGCESKDRPGAQGGVSYYDLVDKLEPHFPAVTMIGQAPFAGATLVEYGVANPEPLLDGTLVPKGERVEHYLALATGANKVSVGGYAVVQLPMAQVQVQVQSAPAPVKEAPKAAPPASVSDLETLERLKQREKALGEMQDALVKHKQEMDGARAELRERDAFIRELELDARERDRLRSDAARAEKRALDAETREREARKKLAETEGKQLGARAQILSHAPTNDAERIVALEAECERLRKKEEEARGDAWKALKARSEAEAQAAEVREDTVRKLKDARKLATVELTRALESASTKAVTLREDLERSERLRKELQAEIEQLRSQPPPPSAPPVGDAAAFERVQSALMHERARSERLIADERRALHERDEARARAAEAEARTAALSAQIEGLTAAREEERDRAVAAENEVRERKERNKQLKRELAEAQAGAAQVEGVRARLAEVEQALRGEEQRMALLEDALRRAAAQAPASGESQS